MTYNAIIDALYLSEAGAHLLDNAALSYPVPSRKEDGTLVDNFFQFFSHSGRSITPPISYFGIQAEAGALDYFRREKPRLIASGAGSPLLITGQQQIAAPKLVSSAFRSRQNSLGQRYKQLYPQVRNFAFSESLNPDEKAVLKDYFLVQFSLFGSRMGSYRQASPRFYSWMIDTLGSEVSFITLLNTGAVRITDFRNFLEMAEHEVEKKKLIGLPELSYEVLMAKGLNAIRKILYAAKEQIDPWQVAAQDYQGLLAARSYSTHDTEKLYFHEARLEEVRQLARSIREEYAIELPVDVCALADELGIQVEEQLLPPDVDGFAKLDVADPVITINTKPKRNFYARKRFTLAHEIAHVVIPWHTGTAQCLTDNIYVPGSDGKLIDIQEKEANVFASELLIPSELLRKKKAKAMDLKHALDNVIRETKTSTLACLYAMERILEKGEVLCVYSSITQKWKFFRGPNACSWATEEEAFALLDSGSYRKETFIKGTYTICYYQPVVCETE